MGGLQLEESAGYDRQTIDYIQRAAASGLYEIRGLGAERRVPNFDDLLFLAASLSRYPLEGAGALCDQDRARRPLRLQAHRARHSDHRGRHELRRAVGTGEGRAGSGGHRGGHFAVQFAIRRAPTLARRL